MLSQPGEGMMQRNCMTGVPRLLCSNTRHTSRGTKRDDREPSDLSTVTGSYGSAGGRENPRTMASRIQAHEGNLSTLGSQAGSLCEIGRLRNRSLKWPQAMRWDKATRDMMQMTLSPSALLTNARFSTLLESTRSASSGDDVRSVISSVVQLDNPQ